MSSDTSSAAQLDRQEIVAWRFHELLEAGYSWDGSARLAVDAEIDLHVALDLLEHGCPETTALRILA